MVVYYYISKDVLTKKLLSWFLIAYNLQYLTRDKYNIT